MKMWFFSHDWFIVPISSPNLQWNWDNCDLRVRQTNFAARKRAQASNWNFLSKRKVSSGIAFPIQEYPIYLSSHSGRIPDITSLELNPSWSFQRIVLHESTEWAIKQMATKASASVDGRMIQANTVLPDHPILRKEELN